MFVECPSKQTSRAYERVANLATNDHSLRMRSNVPNRLETISSEHRALALLRLLLRAAKYTSNELLMSDWLTAIGLAYCSSQLKRPLRELEEAGLLVTREVKGTLVAKLSNRGAEVADGKEVVECVLRPPPECLY